MNVDDDRMEMLLTLRQGGVTDDRILRRMEAVDRALFVPEAFRDRAYADSALPIDCHQTISQPLVVGLMTQALAVGDRMKVLEVGTGSGYQSAVLAPFCRRLYTIERHAALLKGAEALFRSLRLENVTTLLGDGTRGWPEQAPFQRILVTAAAPDLPPVLIDQLAPGGVMVAPIGDAGHQRLLKVTKGMEGDLAIEDLCGVLFVPLVAGLALRGAD
ncbi:MAG: protein-L-isoaspartate(D-aspartate) O-methyltransferase [Rhodospirillales bacterium]